MVTTTYSILFSIIFALFISIHAESNPHLRSTPQKRLSEREAKTMLIRKGLFDIQLNKDGYGIRNKYELQKDGKVVVDHATGLMWQQSGSRYHMFYTRSHLYVDSLNRVKFAGYDDWRLPTLEEAMSLMERENEESDYLHINPVFDEEQWWIVTADRDSSYWAWVVFYSMGYCSRHPAGNFSIYVRAVRDVDGHDRHDDNVSSPTYALYGAKIPFPDAQVKIPDLRSRRRKNLSEAEVRTMLRDHNFYCNEGKWSKKYSNPEGVGYPNNFAKRPNGQVVIDLSAGLVWQQSVPPQRMSFAQAQAYIASLNEKKFGGYDDWRLPTLEEAMSLIEPDQQSGDLYIDPVFDEKPQVIWTGDGSNSSQVWTVVYRYGICVRAPLNARASVRAVR